MSGYFYSNCTKLDPLSVKCRSKNVVKRFLHFNRAFFGDLWLISFSGKSSSGNKMEKKRKEKKGKGKENVNKKKGHVGGNGKMKDLRVMRTHNNSNRGWEISYDIHLLLSQSQSSLSDFYP